MKTLGIFNVATPSRWRLCIGLAINFGGFAVVVNAMLMQMTIGGALQALDNHALDLLPD